ncbi:MAG: heavy-metal-associated domain-containing protein [Lachnospiraceae bacterium]
MADIIIIAVIVILVWIGIRQSITHFKGEGGCCGGSSTPVKVKRKKLRTIVAKKTVIVEGMTCEHCKNRVENSLNKIDGVAARVNLKKKEAVVSMEKEVSDEQIREAIEKAGYRVVKIQ